MGKIVDIEQYKQSGGMSESQHKDLEMYRKLGVAEVFKIEGKSDEDCELKWLNAITDKDTDVVYVDDPNVTRCQTQKSLESLQTSNTASQPEPSRITSTESKLSGLESNLPQPSLLGFSNPALEICVESLVGLPEV